MFPFVKLCTITKIYKNMIMHNEDTVVILDITTAEETILDEGIRHVIKNYIIPEELWDRIINEEFVQIEDERDICTRRNIEFYQNLLKRKLKSNVVSLSLNKTS